MKVSAIELDTSIQCRADIDIATVNEYAEAMREGADFPPVILFGTAEKCWIGDGWHRVMAARSVGAEEITADLRPGGRADALRYALSANAVHGRRRTNADKRCAVAIALREFGKMSDRAIAEMCAVNHEMVGALRRVLDPGGGNRHVTATRTGRDGKEYPAHPAPTARPSYDGPEPEVHTPLPAPADLHLPKPGPPRNGMQFARMAVMDLEQIRPDDLERDQAIRFVRGWLDEHK